MYNRYSHSSGGRAFVLKEKGFAYKSWSRRLDAQIFYKLCLKNPLLCRILYYTYIKYFYTICIFLAFFLHIVFI